MHPEFGWISSTVRNSNLLHPERASVGERRPPLMYGDSFTACVVPEEDCWEGLMEETLLATEFGVINYGVKGYGLGQTYLMLKGSLEHLDDQNLVVFDFRGAPKPEFRIDGGVLTNKYLGDITVDAWLEENPIGIRSYFYTYMNNCSGLVPWHYSFQGKVDREVIQRKIAVSKLLLVAVHDELEARGLDYFFLIFEGPTSEVWAGTRVDRLRRPFLYKTLDELELPWVSAERALSQEVADNKRAKLADYFIPGGVPGGRHYNLQGNRAAMNSVIRGVLGEFDQAADMPKPQKRKKRSQPKKAAPRNK
ncbi:MAG: hypothetical protein ACI8X5_002833 [Planctomycetota bacterium]|jgi:hypothetical protein